MEKIVNKLKEKNKTISTMESCTGGALVNSITNIKGASNVLKFSAVTYSEEYKIKMGVSKDIIKEYSVYSIETAMDMSKKIKKYANSDYGIGITGKLDNKENIVYISICTDADLFITKVLKEENVERTQMKKIIIDEIEKMLYEIIK